MRPVPFDVPLDWGDGEHQTERWEAEYHRLTGRDLSAITAAAKSGDVEDTILRSVVKRVRELPDGEWQDYDDAPLDVLRVAVEMSPFLPRP